MNCCDHNECCGHSDDRIGAEIGMLQICFGGRWRV